MNYGLWGRAVFNYKLRPTLGESLSRRRFHFLVVIGEAGELKDVGLALRSDLIHAGWGIGEEDNLRVGTNLDLSSSFNCLLPMESTSSFVKCRNILEDNFGRGDPVDSSK